MEEIKDKRLDEVYAIRYKLLQTVYEFHCRMNSKETFPPIGDFVLSPKAQPIHDMIWKTPRTEEITQPQLIRVLLREIKLNEITKEWKEGIRARLDLDGQGKDARYKCKRCNKSGIHGSEEIFGHPCCLQMNPMAKWEYPKYNPFIDFAWATYDLRFLAKMASANDQTLV